MPKLITPKILRSPPRWHALSSDPWPERPEPPDSWNVKWLWWIAAGAVGVAASAGAINGAQIGTSLAANSLAAAALSTLGCTAVGMIIGGVLMAGTLYAGYHCARALVKHKLLGPRL